MALLTLAAMAASHSVQIPHHGTQVEATYAAHVEIRSKTVGAYTPNRMDGQRCRWVADVTVERKLAHAPTLARTVSRERHLEGSMAGACTRDRNAITKQIARQDGRLKTHLATVAVADRPKLLAELDAVRAMASN